MATWPSSLPDFRLPLRFKDDSGVLRTQMDSGPDKVRRRYSAVSRKFSTHFVCDGDQLDTLETFYDSTLSAGALSFERTDPHEGTTEDFRFLETFEVQQLAGGATKADRSYRVTLKLERLP